MSTFCQPKNGVILGKIYIFASEETNIKKNSDYENNLKTNNGRDGGAMFG